MAQKLTRKQLLLERVGRAAAQAIENTAPEERPDLWEGISLVLSNPQDVDQARRTAFLLREAEASQLSLIDQLTRPSL